MIGFCILLQKTPENLDQLYFYIIMSMHASQGVWSLMFLYNPNPKKVWTLCKT